MRALFIGMCALLLSGEGAHADDIVGYAGDPDGCFIQVTREPASDMLHVYPTGRNASRDCDVTPTMLEGALEAAFKHTATGNEPQPLRLIFLGRVADYPWLSQRLSIWAGHDQDWDPATGHAAAGNRSDNAVVASMLSHMVKSDQESLNFLPGLLRRYGFRFSGASVEKVMAGPDGQLKAAADSATAPLLPVDALLHLRIGKNR